MTFFAAGRTLYAPVAWSNDSNTIRFASSGRYFSAGSSRAKRPCSYNCIAATEVTALVIEAIRKSASAVIGRSRPTSALPNAPWYRMRSRVAAMTTSPGTSPRVTAAAKASSSGEDGVTTRPA